MSRYKLQWKSCQHKSYKIKKILHWLVLACCIKQLINYPPSQSLWLSTSCQDMQISHVLIINVVASSKNFLLFGNVCTMPPKSSSEVKNRYEVSYCPN